jgi:creatinine amidohydrolase/Fe(II)-dependent formamide hydrolase-like protein
MALGKHNARVKALAERIARELGIAIVAPVVAYVPEGSIEPPTGHMRFPGTITVREETFRQTLESAAQSLPSRLSRHRVSRRSRLDPGRRASRRRSPQPRVGGVTSPRTRRGGVPPRRDGRLRCVTENAATGLKRSVSTRASPTPRSRWHSPRRLVRSTSRVEPGAGEASGVEGDPKRASAELGQLGVDLIVSKSVSAIRKSIETSKR